MSSPPWKKPSACALTMMRFADLPGIVATPLADVRPPRASAVSASVIFSLSSRPALAALPIDRLQEPRVLAADHEARRRAARESRIDVLRVSGALDGVNHAHGAELGDLQRHALFARAEERRLRAHTDNRDLALHVSTRQVHVNSMA